MGKEAQRALVAKIKSFIYNRISAPSVLCISLLHANRICGYRRSKIPVFNLYFLCSTDYSDSSCCSGGHEEGKLSVKETGGISDQMGRDQNIDYGSFGHIFSLGGFFFLLYI